MDCAICKMSQTAFPIYGAPAYTICEACYEGAQNIINLINKIDTENGNAKASTSTHSPTSSCKSFSDASKRLVDLTEQLSFFRGIVDAFKNQTPSDILLKPGNNGSPVDAQSPTTTSKIFKSMLELETLTELNHEELKSFSTD